MNRATISTTVRSVIARVLEEASFVFTDTIEEQDRPDPGTWNAMGVSLTFDGTRKGCFRLWAEEGFAKVLASNMLGFDINDALASETIVDAFMEMTNIFVGNALTELFGNAAVFELGIPEEADPALREGDYRAETGIWLMAEGYHILCVVAISND